MRKLGVKPTIEEQIKEFKKNEAAKRRSVRFDGNLGALSMIKPVRGLMAGKIHFAPEQGDNKLKEINDIFKNCLSAVTTNRVGTQNAFELQMIEHLEDLINLNDDEVEDEINEEFLEAGDFNLHFSRASKALEGASRIYGFRVEAIYDRAFNFISHMSGKGVEGEGLGIEEEDEDDEAVRIAKEERERRETEEREKKEREIKEKERLEKEEEERLKVMERIKTEEEGGGGDDDILKGEEGEGGGEKGDEEMKKETADKKGKEEFNNDDASEENEREFAELEQLNILNKTIKPEDGSYFKRKQKRFYLGESGASLAKRSELDLDDLALTNIAVDTFFLKVNNIFDHSSAEFYLLPNLELDDDFSLQFDGDVEICEHRKRQVEAKLEKELSKATLGEDKGGSNDDSDVEVNVFFKKKSMTREGEGEEEGERKGEEKEKKKTEGMGTEMGVEVGEGREGSTKGLIDMDSFKKRREELLKPGSTSFLDDVDVTEEDTEQEKQKVEKVEETVAEKEKRLLYLKNQKFTSNYKKKVYVNFQKLANDFFKEDLEEAFEEAVSDIRFQAEELKEKMKEEFHGKSLTGFDWTDMAQSMLDMIMEGQVRAEEEDENEEEHEEGSQKLKREERLSLRSSEEKTEERKIKVKEVDVSSDVHSDADYDLKNDVGEVEVIGIVKREEQNVDGNKVSVTNYSEGSTRSDDSEETNYFEKNVEFDIKNVEPHFEKEDIAGTPEAPIEVEQCDKSSELSWLLELDGVSEAEPTVRVNIKEDDTGFVELEVKTEFGIVGVLDRGETEKQLNGEMDEQLVEQLQLTNEGDSEDEIRTKTSELWNKLSAGEGNEKESAVETHAYTEEKGNELVKETEKEKGKGKEKNHFQSRSDTESQCLSDDSLWNVNQELRNKLEKKMGEEKLLKTLMSVNIVDSDSSYDSLNEKWIQKNASWKQAYGQADDEDEDEDRDSEDDEGYEEDEHVKKDVGKQNKRKGSMEVGDEEEEKEEEEEKMEENGDEEECDKGQEKEKEKKERGRDRGEDITRLMVKKEIVEEEEEEEEEREREFDEEEDETEEVEVEESEEEEEKEDEDEGEEVLEEVEIEEGENEENVNEDEEEEYEYYEEVEMEVEGEYDEESEDEKEEEESEIDDKIFKEYNVDTLRLQIEMDEHKANFNMDTEEEDKADKAGTGNEEKTENEESEKRLKKKGEMGEPGNEVDEGSELDDLYDYDEEEDMENEGEEDDAAEEDKNEKEDEEAAGEDEDEEKKEKEGEDEEEEEDDIGIINTISYLEICPEIEYFHEELAKREAIHRKKKPGKRSSKGRRKRKRKKTKKKKTAESDEMLDDDVVEGEGEGEGGEEDADGKRMGRKKNDEDGDGDEDEEDDKEEQHSLEEQNSGEEDHSEKGQNSEEEHFKDDAHFSDKEEEKDKRSSEEDEEEAAHDGEQKSAEEKQKEEMLNDSKNQKMSVKEEQNFRLTDTLRFSVMDNSNVHVTTAATGYKQKVLPNNINEKEYRVKSELKKTNYGEIQGMVESNELNEYSGMPDDSGNNMMDGGYEYFNNDFSNNMPNDLNNSIMHSQFPMDDMHMEHVMQASGALNNEHAGFNTSVPHNLQFSQNMASAGVNCNLEGMGLPSMIKTEQKGLQSMNMTMDMSMNMNTNMNMNTALGESGRGTDNVSTQVKSQLFSVKKSQLSAIPDDDILWNRSILSVDNRLRAITYEGPGAKGENYQYISTNKLGVGLGFQLGTHLLPSITDPNKNPTKNKLSLSESFSSQKKIRSPFDIGIVDFYNLHSELNDVELSTYDLWRKERKKEISSIMMGVDMTSLVFEMDEKCVHSVNTLSDRVLKIEVKRKRFGISGKDGPHGEAKEGGGDSEEEDYGGDGDAGGYYDDENDERKKRKVNIIMEDVDNEYGVEEFDDINYVDMGDFQNVYDEDNIDEIPEDVPTNQNVLEQVIDNSFLMETENVWIQQEQQKKRRETVNKIKAVLAEDEDEDGAIAGIATGPPGFNTVDGKKKKKTKSMSKFVDVAKIKQVLAEIVTTPKIEPDYSNIKKELCDDIKAIEDTPTLENGSIIVKNNNDNNNNNNSTSQTDNNLQIEMADVGEDKHKKEENALVSYNSQDNIRTFKSLISETKSKLAGGESDGASVHMLFVCLLYTCNDKGLFLEQIPDANDFYIHNEEPNGDKSNENSNRLMLSN